MAQTMRFVSFGPVLFVVASRRYIRRFNIPVRWLVFIKNTNNVEKNLLMAQTTRNVSFGPDLFIVASHMYIHIINTC